MNLTSYMEFWFGGGTVLSNLLRAAGPITPIEGHLNSCKPTDRSLMQASFLRESKILTVVM